MTPPERDARLVLCAPDGVVFGVTPAFRVDTPWWADAGPVVRAARERLGVEVILIRLLTADPPAHPGGLVTYLAETAAPPTGLEPWTGALEEHPLRLPYARPGGPAADLAWADRALAARGLARTGRARQVRTWNLSSLWQIPAGDETVWLKHVPPFFAHEGALVARLAGGPVPRLIARDGPRILMHEIPGEDLYDADAAVLERLILLLVGLQAAWAGRCDDLRTLGLPDWRAPALGAAIASVIDRTRPELADHEQRVLDRFVAALPERWAAIAEAGLPDTLVHGDFHPGNARGDGTSLVLLDWGDSGIGNPLLDQAAFLARVPPTTVPALRAAWHRAWADAVPGAQPERAADLLAPIAAARQAAIYRAFLDGIEPSEHPYHATDPADWLRRTAGLVAAERGD